MGKIISVSIEGLAGRTDPVSFSLNGDCNVFFGRNGTGKTSLLRIVGSALSQNTSALVSAPFKSAKVVIGSYRGQEYECTIDRTSFAPSTGLVWQVSPALTTFQRFTHSYLPISRLYLSSQSKSGSLTEKRLDEAFADSIAAQWSAYSAETLGAVSKIRHDGLARVFQTVLKGSRLEPGPVIDPESAYARMRNFWAHSEISDVLMSEEDFVRRYNEDPGLASVAQEIHQTEDSVADVLAPREQLQRCLEDMIGGSKRLRLTDAQIEVTSGDGANIGLALLSSGEKQLVKILTVALQSGAHSLIVDEPEMSMHVDWQRVLIDSIFALNADSQLIFATHSPEIMEKLPDSKIFRL